MTALRLPRRTILRGLGASGVALPLLDAMIDTSREGRGTARAASSGSPTRLIAFFFPNGTLSPLWTPKATGGNYSLTDCNVALQPHRDVVNLLSGLENNAAFASGFGSGHATGNVASLTAQPQTASYGGGGPSIEQAAAAEMGGETFLRSLVLGMHGPGLSWMGKDRPSPTLIDPVQIFDKLFPPSAQLANDKALSNHRHSVLDYVSRDAQRLSSRLGQADRARIDDHLTAIRALETRTALISTLTRTQACSTPARPGNIAATDLNFDQRAKLVLDLLVLALTCDLTRYAMTDLGRGNSLDSYPWLGTTQNDHDISHVGSDHEKALHTNYKMGLLAYLLDNMRKVKEGDRDLLYHSILYCGSEIADGSRHNEDDMPVVIAGQGGGAIRSGRHIRYTSGNLGELFLSLLKYAGSKTTQFGLQGQTPLTGLDS